jgi:hypothetical protein
MRHYLSEIYLDGFPSDVCHIEADIGIRFSSKNQDIPCRIWRTVVSTVTALVTGLKVHSHLNFTMNPDLHLVWEVGWGDCAMPGGDLARDTYNSNLTSAFNMHTKFYENFCFHVLIAF